VRLSQKRKFFHFPVIASPVRQYQNPRKRRAYSNQQARRGGIVPMDDRATSHHAEIVHGQPDLFGGQRVRLGDRLHALRDEDLATGLDG
jgi:hypothetical protein